jgi:hypothetical protein
VAINAISVADAVSSELDLLYFASARVQRNSSPDCGVSILQLGYRNCTVEFTPESWQTLLFSYLYCYKVLFYH